jgi:hypothetical protein
MAEQISLFECMERRYTIILRSRSFTISINGLTEEQKNEQIRMLARPLFQSLAYEVVQE